MEEPRIQFETAVGIDAPIYLFHRFVYYFRKHLDAMLHSPDVRIVETSMKYKSSYMPYSPSYVSELEIMIIKKSKDNVYADIYMTSGLKEFKLPHEVAERISILLSLVFEKKFKTYKGNIEDLTFLYVKLYIQEFGSPDKSSNKIRAIHKWVIKKITKISKPVTKKKSLSTNQKSQIRNCVNSYFSNSRSTDKELYDTKIQQESFSMRLKITNIVRYEKYLTQKYLENMRSALSHSIFEHRLRTTCISCDFQRPVFHKKCNIHENSGWLLYILNNADDFHRKII